MQTTSETLINPLVDIGFIPIDASWFLYEMPYLDIEDEQPSTVPRDRALEASKSGINTMDDMRYEMIMSFVHNNALIGF